MTDLTRLSASDLATKLAAGEVSSVEAVRAHLDRIESVDADVHAFLHVAGDAALRTASDIDGRRAAGEPLGPLAGGAALVDLRRGAYGVLTGDVEEGVNVGVDRCDAVQGGAHGLGR